MRIIFVYCLVCFIVRASSVGYADMDCIGYNILYIRESTYTYVCISLGCYCWMKCGNKSVKVATKHRQQQHQQQQQQKWKKANDNCDTINGITLFSNGNIGAIVCYSDKNKGQTQPQPSSRGGRGATNYRNGSSNSIVR